MIKTTRKERINKKRIDDQLFTFMSYFILGLLAIATLFPFYVTFINSISPPEDFINKSIVLFPSKLELGYYSMVLSPSSRIWDAFNVTVFSTIFGTLISMIISIMTAFALSQRTMPYRGPITFFFILTMFFYGGMIPDYLLMRSLHLLNTRWVLIIPSAVSVGTIIYLRNFFLAIPGEIFEAATIDGCSRMKMLPYIVIPLSTASIATFTLFFAITNWNQFYAGVIYITQTKLQPLQVYLRWILYDAQTQDYGDIPLRFRDKIMPPSVAVRSATIMISTLPMVMIYPFVQRYFVKGMTMGSLKG